MHVHANLAMTLDGAIGLPGPQRLRISGPEDKARVHDLRAKADAVLVGIGTVLSDDPKLDVRWDLLGRIGENPLRVVLDARGRTPPTARVVDGRAPTLLVHGPKGPQGDGHLLVPEEETGRLDLRAVLDALADRGVRRLLVEGGQHVLTSFFRSDLVDVLSVYVAPRILGLADAPRLASAPEPLDRRLRLTTTERMGEGVVLHFGRA